jgi:hypothetical protein
MGRVRILLATLALACACAGSGKSYHCDPDAGECGTIQVPDGGSTAVPFVSDPFTIRHDGGHNSSTDVVRFAGAVFAAFRHANGWSVDATSQVVIARSGDKGRTWTETATLRAGPRDLRQPKLFVFGGKLYVVATAWESGDPSRHRTSVRIASSDDGIAFTAFAEVPGQTGLSAWRPRQFGSRLFLSVWAADELFPAQLANRLALLSSSDGMLFTPAGVPPAGAGAREGELIVRASGERWLAAPERSISGSGDKQTFCRAPATDAVLSWSCWSVSGSPIESPVLFEWSGLLFVAGKRNVGNGRMRTSIWQVIEDDHALSPVADVPASFGDTGGPGVVQLDKERALLTFHTTSALDPRVAALGHEPSEVETQSVAMAADVLAVELYLPSAAAGH